MTIPLDYDILRVIWWLFLGVLLIGFAVMDGFDLGVATLLPFIAHNDIERRVAINTVGPVWDGNQVWLLLGGGAVFAAWPMIYATAFSGFYLALFLVLASLILRPTGFDFRNKVADPRWRGFWDWCLFASGLVPSLVFGVAFGNLLQGVPFRIDADMRVFYVGSGLFELLNPFGLMAGLVSVAMLTTHGAVYLALKSDGAVRRRATSVAPFGALTTAILFALSGVWLAFAIPGYTITDAIAGDGPSNPLLKQVSIESGAWLTNYGRHPWMLLAPIFGLGGAVLTALLAGRRPGLAFVASGIALFGIIATAGVSMFPFLLPSDIEPSASLTVWDASSSQRTLFVMLIATLVLLPIVIAYTGLVFRVLRGRVTPEEIERDPGSHY